MRIDAVTIFPDYFQVMNLSLLGKAQEKNIVEFHAHDLRNYATDIRKTVDDTPFGGGAGMVMKADVWSRAIDDVIAEKPLAKKILLIPAASGRRLDQKFAQELLQYEQLIFACGRYEGIDSRVYDYYKDMQNDSFQVQEFSIGDYVLNGGEVATLVAIEATTRLIPGMMGNPQSMVEESYCDDGLLEYSIYTRPKNWRGLQVPNVLLSGNHEEIRKFRRRQSLQKTISRRFDIIAEIASRSPDAFDWYDRSLLAQNGYLLKGNAFDQVEYSYAQKEDIAELTTLAKQLFPLASPDTLDSKVIDKYCENKLTEDFFEKCINAPEVKVLLAKVQEKIVGYCLYYSGQCDFIEDKYETSKICAKYDVQPHTLASINKCYVKPEYMGSGLAAQLMNRAITDLSPKASYIWLGTNIANKRAIKFYKKMGFKKCGTRIFDIEGHKMSDHLFSYKAQGQKF